MSTSKAKLLNSKIEIETASSVTDKTPPVKVQLKKNISFDEGTQDTLLLDRQ